MIELTDEMRAAVKGRMGIPRGAGLDPWMEAAIEDVLALVERDFGSLAAAAERARIRSIVAAPLLAAVRCVPDGEIRHGCVVQDGESVRWRAKQAYCTAFPNEQDGDS